MERKIVNSSILGCKVFDSKGRQSGPVVEYKLSPEEIEARYGHIKPRPKEKCFAIRMSDIQRTMIKRKAKKKVG